MQTQVCQAELRLALWLCACSRYPGLGLQHSTFCIHHPKSSYAPPPIKQRIESTTEYSCLLLFSVSILLCLNFGHSLAIPPHFHATRVHLAPSLKHPSIERHRIILPSFLHKVRSLRSPRSLSVDRPQRHNIPPSTDENKYQRPEQ